jgi:hypothetical protein
MVDDFISHFLHVEHFTERCLKFKCEMEAAVAPYRDVYNDKQRKAKQLKMVYFFTNLHMFSLHFPEFHTVVFFNLLQHVYI